MDKQNTTVRVAGKEYTLVSSDSPEHMHRVAAFVDRQLSEIIYASRVPASSAAILLAINMADELMKAQDENARLRHEVEIMGEKQ